MTAENLQALPEPGRHLAAGHASELPGGSTVYDREVLTRLMADAAEVVARYPQPRSALLPLLHLVQSVDGYVSQRGIEFCARTLALSTAEVAGVATFYTQYKRHPNGEYTVGVCTNTLCAIMGGDAIFDALSEHLDVGHDETTDDGKITLERLECNAACDFAPVMMVNWEFFDNQTPGSARAVVDDLRSGAPVRPTRGPSRVCSFKEVSRTLAGFSDGLADEGVGAGGATLEGLKLAREKGWSAPSVELGSREGSGDAPVEQVAAEHIADPAHPSANDAAAQGQAGDAATDSAEKPAVKRTAAKRAPRKPKATQAQATQAQLPTDSTDSTADEKEA